MNEERNWEHILGTWWEQGEKKKKKKKNPPHPPPALRWGPFEVQFFKYFDNELIWLANHSKNNENYVGGSK